MKKENLNKIKPEFLNRKTFGSKVGYLQGAGLVALITLFAYLAQSFLDPFNSALLYVLCIIITAILWGLGPSILVCFLSILTHELLYIVTFQNFGLPDFDNVPTLIVLLLVGVTASYLAAQVRSQTEKARRREEEMHTLYMLSRNLAATDDLSDSVHIILKTAKEIFGYDMLIFLPEFQGKQLLKLYAENTGLNLGEEAIKVASWSFEHHMKAGSGTEMFPDSPAHCIPLITVRGTVGVIAIWMGSASNELTLAWEQFFNAFADLAAVAIERIAFAAEARDMKISQAATEKLQTAFLDSISHEMRTPLATVIGALSSLKEEMELDSYDRASLIEVASEEAENLNHLITNLLDFSRIQAGAIKLSRQPCAVNDIVSVALDRLGDKRGQRKIATNVDVGLPFVNVDFGLIVKVMFNLLDNAFKYSAPESPVEIKARQDINEVEIEVADHGAGIPPQDLPHIFQRFYRVSTSEVPGTGLGLSICKGIVEAHGGRIAAQNRDGGGIIVRVTLPIVESGIQN